MNKFVIILIAMVAYPILSLAMPIKKIVSPSSNLSVATELRSNKLYLILYSEDKRVVEIRSVDFNLQNEIVEGDWQVVNQTMESHNGSWKPLFGERNIIVDNYNNLKITLSSEVNRKTLDIEIRLYNEGLAFRYIFDKLDFWNSVVTSENTAFNFGSNCNVWATGMSQGGISKIKINDLKGDNDRPLLVELEHDLYAAVGEASLVDYSRMKLKGGEQLYSVTSSLHGEVNLAMAGYHSPWRYVMVGNTVGQLLEGNDMILNLNEPNEIDDISWIKPGTVLREVTLTDQGAYASIDYAVKNGIDYVEFDAGWYGHEYSKDSDASEVNLDPGRSKGPFNLEKIIEYSNKHGVGIILYVNMNALRKQLDQILPLYEKWGIKGVKYGFVDVGSQYNTSWLHHAVRKAAKYHLMVDIHDDYRPTGYSRTYPNLITQEGIRGDEESPSVKHSIYTIFTRMLCGAGDNTNCYFAERVPLKMGGKGAQMAKAIAIYSPWQFIYWYDRPEGSPLKAAGAGGTEPVIVDGNDNQFYNNLPTVWDETLVLEGDIEQFATIARRSSDNWYVGSLNSGNSRDVSLDLSFLDENRNYEAIIYYQKSRDLLPENNRVRIKQIDLGKERSIEIPVETNSGFAVVLRPKN